MRLSLMDYFSYLNGNENSRSVSEGEAVLNAGHIILCGITNFEDDFLTIYSLCLQTSALTSDPHEIRGVFQTDNDILRIKSMLCTCKAGNSGKCKHISAVLIWCTRSNVNDWEPISKTDIKCAWVAQKYTTKEDYKPVPVNEMPCFSQNIARPTIQLDKNKTFADFLNRLPESALSLHNRGRRSLPTPSTECSPDISHFASNLVNNASQSILMLELSTEQIDFHNTCCKELYTEIFENTDIDSCVNTNQHTKIYLKERKYRVTGSRIYELYTYSKQDWEKKSLDYFWPKNINNKFVRHGIKYEKEVRCEFISKTGMQVYEFGLYVPHSNKWLGYSPDGVVFENEEPVALIEIKCLFAGATMNIKEALKTIKYLEYRNGALMLRKRYKYYGQVQLGMAVLNLSKCYFILYASYDKSLEIIEIYFDNTFCKNMLLKVKKLYFDNMLHYLCLRK